jgi:hypothetical protein
LKNQSFKQPPQAKQNQRVILSNSGPNPELNLMTPMKANRLMAIAKTVRSIVK